MLSPEELKSARLEIRAWVNRRYSSHLSREAVFVYRDGDDFFLLNSTNVHLIICKWIEGQFFVVDKSKLPKRNPNRLKVLKYHGSRGI